ncbi:hypothetical protein COO72_10885 [Bifidobacterium callitrichos]|nr:hypothetical protein COO72_10885 [Bifidobacterium callitrichos]
MDELDDLASRRERITQTILFWAAYLAGLQSIKDLGPSVGKAALLRRVADWIMAIPEVIRSWILLIAVIAAIVAGMAVTFRIWRG